MNGKQKGRETTPSNNALKVQHQEVHVCKETPSFILFGYFAKRKTLHLSSQQPPLLNLILIGLQFFIF